jgi:hypothetical protein
VNGSHVTGSQGMVAAAETCRCMQALRDGSHHVDARQDGSGVICCSPVGQGPDNPAMLRGERLHGGGQGNQIGWRVTHDGVAVRPVIDHPRHPRW